MILRTLFTFLLLLISVYIGAKLQQDPGYVLIAVHHWTIETTLWIAIPLLLIIILMVHLIIITFHKITHIPTTWSKWRRTRRVLRAEAKTRQGLIEFSEGHWQSAKKHLINALPDANTPLLNYLTAARAAEEMGDHTLRDDYLRQAQQSMPEAKIAVELTQAQLQIANQQWEQALATLKHLKDLSPNHPYVLKLLMQLYEEIKDWTQLIALLPTLKRHRVLSSDAFFEIQRHAYINACRDLVKLDREDELTDLIKNLPTELTYDPDLVLAYVSFLLSNNQDKKAEAILHKCLQKNISEKLIELYSRIKHEYVKLDFIESLLKTNSHSAALHLCLGKIGVSKQLFGKAKLHIEQSIQLNPTPEAYLVLGNLFEKLNDQNAACNAFKNGLSKTILPEHKIL